MATFQTEEVLQCSKSKVPNRRGCWRQAQKQKGVLQGSINVFCYCELQPS